MVVVLLRCDAHVCSVSVLVLVDASDVYERRELHREVLKVLHYMYMFCFSVGAGRRVRRL